MVVMTSEFNFRTAITACPAGRYSAGSTDECFNCEKVRSTQPNLSSKSTKTHLLTFHSACFSRSQGKFVDNSGASSCEFCDTKVWKYTTFPELVPPTVSMTSDQCMCEAGKFEKVVCRAGEDGDGDVLPCPHNDVVLKSGRPTCVLLEALNLLSTSATANETKRGMTTQTLDLAKGFWRVTEDSTRVLDCEVPENCLGGDNMTAMCIQGTTGPFCDVCDTENGYAKQAGDCVACEGDRSKTATALVAAACATLVSVIALACIATRFPGCAAKLEGLFKWLRKLYSLAGKYKVQVSRNPPRMGKRSECKRRAGGGSSGANNFLLLLSLASAKEELAAAAAAPTIFFLCSRSLARSLSCARSPAAQFKTLAAYAQITTALSFNLELSFVDLAYFTGVMKYLNITINVFAVNFSWIMPMSCVITGTNFLTTTYGMCSTYLAIMAGLFAASKYFGRNPGLAAKAQDAGNKARALSDDVENAEVIQGGEDEDNVEGDVDEKNSDLSAGLFNYLLLFTFLILPGISTQIVNT
jgi:hypothetical protein